MPHFGRAKGARPVPCAGQICASLHFTASFRDQGRPVVRVATIVPWPNRPGLSARTCARNAMTTCRGWDRFCSGRAILVRAMHPARFSTRCGGRPAALRKEGISHSSLRPRPGVKIQTLQPEWLTSRLDTWFVGHTDPWRGHRRPVSSQARSIPPPTRGPHPVRPYRPCRLAVAVTARHPRMVCGPAPGAAGTSVWRYVAGRLFSPICDRAGHGRVITDQMSPTTSPAARPGRVAPRSPTQNPHGSLFGSSIGPVPLSRFGPVPLSRLSRFLALPQSDLSRFPASLSRFNRTCPAFPLRFPASASVGRVMPFPPGRRPDEAGPATPDERRARFRSRRRIGPGGPGRRTSRSVDRGSVRAASNPSRNQAGDCRLAHSA